MIAELLEQLNQQLLSLIFFALYSLCFLMHLSIHFSVCILVEQIGKQQPWRKIQRKTSRYSTKDELLQSLPGFISTPFCVALAIFISAQSGSPDVFSNIWVELFAGFIFLLLVHDLWFYWTHRLLHTRYFVKWHRLHHQSLTPTVWTNDRFSLPDALLSQIFLVLASLLVPLAPLALIGYRIVDQIKGILGHSGFEFAGGRISYWPFPFVAVQFHDSHHELYKYNFGNSFSICDRLFGTLDPDYDLKVAGFRESMKSPSGG